MRDYPVDEVVLRVGWLGESALQQELQHAQEMGWLDVGSG